MYNTGQEKSGLLNRKYQLDLQPPGGGGVSTLGKEKVGKIMYNNVKMQGNDNKREKFCQGNRK